MALRSSRPERASDSEERVLDRWLARFRAERAKGLRPKIEPFLEQLEPSLRSQGRDRLVEELARRVGTLQISACHASQTEGASSSYDTQRSHSSVVNEPLAPDDPSTDLLIHRLTAVRDLVVQSSPPVTAVHMAGFHVIEELGRGAYGVVYRARDELLDRQVAIKVPLLKDPKWRQQYIDEARRAVRLEFPGIVPIYHIGISSDGQPFVVQKLIDGPTLRCMLTANSGSLPILQTVRLILEVSRSVAAAHSMGIVHRDLKPENLLMDADGNPWVADFGLAIREEEQSKKRGEIAGTPLYMSPEQFRGRTDWLDGRSDIWSIGVMFYEMLVGKLPFEAPDFEDLKEQILHKQPRPLQQRSPLISRALDDIFSRCCDKDVSLRYPTAALLVSDLEAFLVSSTLAETDRADEGVGISSISRRAETTRRKSNLPKGASYSLPLGATTSSVSDIPFVRLLSINVALILSALALVLVIWFSIYPDGTTVSISAKTPLWPVPLINPNSNLSLDGPSPNPTPLPTIKSKRGVKPKGPFTVDASGTGTHLTLSDALADCNDGDIIFVSEGIYRESLVVNHSIRIIGNGDGEKTWIQVVDSTCLSIQGESQVEVSNLRLSALGDKTIEGIDLMHGSLVIRNCQISSDNGHCIVAQPHSSLVVQDCVFLSSAYAAIRVDQSQNLAIYNCVFRCLQVGNRSDSGIGIQVANAGGLIAGCVFEGMVHTCIDWRHAENAPIQIVQCTFKDCETGLATRGCRNLKVSGTVDHPLEFINCRRGIVMHASHGKLSNIVIASDDERSIAGATFTQGTEVKVDKLTIRGYLTGMDIQSSRVNLASSHIQNQREIGIVAQNSRLVMNSVDISDAEYFGIVVYEDGSFVDACDVMLRGSSFGLYLAQGHTTIKESICRDCKIGVQVGALDQEKNSQFSRTSDIVPSVVPVKFSANAIFVSGGEVGIHYRAPSITRLIDAQFSVDHELPDIVWENALTKTVISKTDFNISSAVSGKP